MKLFLYLLTSLFAMGQSIIVPPARHQQFLIPIARLAAQGLRTPTFALVGETAAQQTRFVDMPTNIYTDAVTFQCNLTQIRKVRITPTPYGIPYWCVVFGRTPSPRIGSTDNIHIFSACLLQAVQDTAGANLQPAWISIPVEQELGTDYRYFTVYVYSNNASSVGGLSIPVAAAFGGASSYQLLSILFTGS